MWENKQPVLVKLCPWESARFQLRPGGARNIMWRGTGAPEGRVKRGGRKAVGGWARRKSTEQYGNKIMKTGSQKGLYFWSLQGCERWQSWKQLMAERSESEVWNKAVQVSQGLISNSLLDILITETADSYPVRPGFHNSPSWHLYTSFSELDPDNPTPPG